MPLRLIARMVLAGTVTGGTLAAGTLAAQAAPAATLLALSKTERTLAIVDPATLKIIARIPVGPDPHEVIASTDGRLAFVSNYGGGQYNTLAVVDLVAQRALAAVDLGALRGPHGLDFAAGKVWFTAEAAKAIGSYDPAAQKLDWILGTGQNRTHMIYVFSDARRMVTSNVSSATLSFIDRPAPNADWNETVVPVGRGAEGFDVTPDGKELWTANAQDGTVSVVDVAAKRVVQTIDAHVTGANRLKFTQDGRNALVSTLSGGDVTVLDVATRAVSRRIPVGRGAAGIQMQPDGARAFVACSPDDYIAVIDLKTWVVTGHLDVGKQPDGMAWAVRR